MLNWGFRTDGDFSFGGFSGRYGRDFTEKNSKGELLNYWRVLTDSFTDREGHATSQESMWPFVRDIQHDLAARARCGITKQFGEAEHRPALTIREGLNFQMTAGGETYPARRCKQRGWGRNQILYPHLWRGLPGRQLDADYSSDKSEPAGRNSTGSSE